MPGHISVRDVQFTPSTKGVRIIVTTDVPSILYCRLTSEEPWIHKKPSLRRGVQFAEDVRFCFVVYEDNVQYEATETLIHTFWKEDWPPCTTKWCYFWGTISGEASISTSPFFKYHNTGISPVPTPDIMNVFNSIEPQLLTSTPGVTWNTFDCSHFVNPDSNGVILYIRNKHTTSSRLFGLRMKGQVFGITAGFLLKSHNWGVVGLDSNKCFEAYAAHLAYFDVWAMGYTGHQVKFLAEPYDVTPAANDVWTDIDVSVQCPGAIGALLSGPGWGYTAWKFDARKKGSTDDHYIAANWNTPFVGLDAAQVFQAKGQAFATRAQQLYVIGYITADAYVYTDVQQMPNWPLGSWHDQAIDYQTAAPKWGIIKVTCSAGGTIWAARKKGSLRDLKYSNNYRLYVYIHCNPEFKIEYYRDEATQLQYLLAEVA